MRVLLVDDDRNLRMGIKLNLEREGVTVSLAESFESGMRKISKEEFDVLIFDIRLGDMTGLDLFSKIKKENVETPVIFISSGASLSEVADVMRMGAFDFLEKPFSDEKLLNSIKNAVLIKNLQTKIDFLNGQSFKGATAFGDNKDYVALVKKAIKVARTLSTVLITGESGTGKEVLAKKIHLESARSKGPYVKVNCSAIPENLIESELFGHEKGAFTGAERSKRGFFEVAHTGTIFLDEVGDMSLAAQAKVLRALQDSEIQKLGSEKIINVDVRVIAATNKDLEKGIQEGWFREDLYFRINVFPLETIPLRKRKDDIPVLAEHFMSDFLKKNSMKAKKFDFRVFEKLKSYDWPGNIRELKNIVERLGIVSDDLIVDSDLSGFIDVKEPLDYAGLTLKEYKELSEKAFLIDSLRRHEGVISVAAKELGIERTYLHRKISQYKISKKDYF
ncbi:MAG: sigma-54-dependent transcriptional regulator [Bdellovibrionales bacterium]